MKQKMSCLISRIMRKQAATQRSYLASLLTLLLIGCCTTSFASQNQNISNSNTSREKLEKQFTELWNRYLYKKAAFVNDCVSKQNDLIQSLMALRKVCLDLGLDTDKLDSRITKNMLILDFFKGYQTNYFDKRDKYNKYQYLSLYDLEETSKW